MYLQITTKCNMKCAHCCYSCSMRGKHGDYNTIIDMVAFARDYGEVISIGGGEPTLHPRFFDILKVCLEDFDYVWMATNGSKTDIMYRLANIIDQEDYGEDYCNCDSEDLNDEDYYCECEYNGIYQEDKLSVALSQDCFHDPIDDKIIDMWTRRSKNGGGKGSHFEIRDVSNSRDGVIEAGRAKRTGSGWAEGCVCSDIFIKPDGKLRLCGCIRSPVIGDIWQGIDEKWTNVIQEDEGYQGTNCYKDIDNKP